MRNILLILLLLISLKSFSQDIPYRRYRTQDYEINMAGYELQKASSTFYSGVVVMVAGAIISVVGIYTPADKTTKFGDYTINNRDGLIVGGAALGGTGLIISLSSFKSIRRAGRHLENY